MIEQVGGFFQSEEFMPHGYCLMWRPDIFWMHVASDAIIALAYFTIPIAVAVFAFKRKVERYRWVLIMFAAFVMACGITHVLGIWTMWNPDYGVQGLAKAATALISIATAAVIWPLLPKALKIPTVSELEATVKERTEALVVANQALKAEVAERARAETELVAARHEAETANNAKSSFLSIMSHELRTPLNAILGYAQLLQLDAPHMAQQKVEFAGNIQQSGEHLLALIEDILDLSRVESGRLSITPKTVNAGDALQAALSEATMDARKKDITLDLAKPDAALGVLADQVRLHQALINLVTNAIKYNDAGGTVRVAARTLEQAPDSVVLEVQDDGWGIPEDRREELFQPFARLGRDAGEAPGAGIGLALTRRLIESLDGALEYEPVPSGGSLFRITLPRRTALGDAPEAAAASEPAEAFGRTVTALVVEDNALNVDLMRRVLGLVDPDIDVQVARTGARAIELARRARPDIVLVDLGLPDGDGLAVSQEIERILGPEPPPIIVVTADAAPATRKRVTESGAYALLHKPFQVGPLVDLVRGAILGESPARAAG